MAPNGKPNAVPRSHGFHERRGVVAAEPRRAGDVRALVGRDVAEARRHVQRLADGEQADRDEHDVHAGEQLVDAEGQARLPRELVDADEADREPEGERQQPADERAPDQRGHRHEGQHHEREVLRRLQLDREVGDRLGEERQQDQADRARR